MTTTRLSWWLLLWLCLVHANTETFLLTLDAGASRGPATVPAPPLFSEHYFDLSTTARSHVSIDLEGLKRPDAASAYFVRVCWSAVHPIDVALSHDAAEGHDLFTLHAAADYYGLNQTAIAGLLAHVPVQVSFSPHASPVPTDMLRLAVHLAAVAAAASALAYIVL